MKVKPLPHPNDDPANQRARQVKAQYAQDLSAIQTDATVTPLERARRARDLHEKASAELAGAWEDVTRRRQARMESLQAQLPLGPQIPEGTSPADKAVMMASFQSALDWAREAELPQVARRLDDAEKYGDDMSARAIATLAIEQGGSRLREMYVGRHPEQTAVFDEIGALHRVMTGQDITTRGFDYQDFGALPVPGGVTQIPLLEQQADAEAARLRQGYR